MQAQTIGIEKLCYRQCMLLYFKGTPSREESKTGFSVLTTFESALPGQIGTIWKTFRHITYLTYQGCTVSVLYGTALYRTVA
jgi:hypothetical protein